MTRVRRFSSRTVLVLALLGGAGIGAGVWLMRAQQRPARVNTGDRGRPGNEGASQTAMQTHAGASAHGGGRPFVPGEQSRYRVTAEQDISFQQSTDAAAPTGTAAPVQAAGPRLHLRLSGDWQVTVVDTAPGTGSDEVHVEAELVNPELVMLTEGRDTLDAGTRQRLLAALALPHYATLAQSGALEKIHFPPECDTLSRGFLRLLLSESQFVAPDVRSDQWETQESDTTGRYLATYQRQFEQNQYKKQKRKYTHINTADGLHPPPPNLSPKLDAQAEFLLGSDFWPDALSAKQHMEVQSGGAFPTVVTTLGLTLKRTARQRDASRIGRFAGLKDRLQTETPYANSALAVNERDQDRRMLDGATLTQLLAAAAALPEGKENEEKRNHATAVLLEKLRALLRLDPAQAAAATQAARTTGDPRIADLLIGALEAATTPESIRGLSELARDPSVGHDQRMHATASLGLAERPTADALGALREVARDRDPDLSSTAALAIGNAGRNFQNNESSQGQSVVEELKSALRNAQSPEEQALLLRALGNTASADALGAILDALKSPLAGIREAAAEALRLLSGREVDQAIARVLLSDPDTPVRRSGVFAGSFREPAALVPIYGQALRSEQTAGVRNDIIHVLGRWGTQTPGVGEILSWVAENDPEPDLRKAAAAYLKPSP